MMKATVNTEALAAQIRVKRDDHQRIYEAAMVQYRGKLIELFEDRVDKLRNDPEAVKEIDLLVRLPRPEEHLGDYDSAIEMLAWHQDDQIVLDQDQFNELVLDKWGWQRSFFSNTTSYVQ
jgi:hypothetical protein